MAKYFVPPSLAPGVYRGSEVGLVRPGEVLELPDDETPPSWRLVAIDDAAAAALRRDHGIDAEVMPPVGTAAR